GRRNQEMQNWRHQYQYLAQQNQSPNGSPTNHFYNDNPEAIASNSGGLHLPGALVSTPSGIFSAAKFPMLETADNLQQSKPALTETFSGENQLLADTLSEVLPETASFSDPPILMDSLAKTENSDPQNLFNVPETKSTVPVSAQYPFYAVDLKNSDIFEDDMLPAYSSVRQASAQVPNTSQNLISQSSYFVQAQAASEKAVPEVSAINSAGTMPERLTAAFPQTTAAPEVRPLNSDSTQNPPVPEESSGKLRVYRPTGSFLPIDTLNNQPVKPE
ncbi:MAG: hypothetical protein IKW74_02645, partial [Thermoguttaceae bacterium]|nr:hypothetical protein [Thermoguttaceae bacterium]